MRCFEHNEAVVADLGRDNLIGRCQTADIPSAVYTHGRVKVEWVKLSVEGTFHDDYYLKEPMFPGTATLFRAYSSTHYDGRTYHPREGYVRVDDRSDKERPTIAWWAYIPLTYAQVSDLPGLKLETIDGEFWMTFPFTHPLPIDQQNLEAHWARFSWETFEAFRWRDAPWPHHTDRVWDVRTDFISHGQGEPVLFTGATGDHVTSSID